MKDKKQDDDELKKLIQIITIILVAAMLVSILLAYVAAKTGSEVLESISTGMIIGCVVALAIYFIFLMIALNHKYL